MIDCIAKLMIGVVTSYFSKKFNHINLNSYFDCLMTYYLI